MPIEGELIAPAAAGENAKMRVAVRQNGQEVFQASQPVPAGDREFRFSIFHPLPEGSYQL